MDPLATVVEGVKGFAKSSHDWVNGLLQRRHNSSHRNPIEILKRLQRESFSDLMKIRDRQDKVERLLSFYGKSKGSPFQEAGTHVRGEVDVLGAVLLMGEVNQEHCDAMERAGIRTGINTKFIFETTVRGKDNLAVEFVSDQNGRGYLGDVTGTPLSLAKVSYKANVEDWFSAIAIPMGAQFRDVDVTTDFSHQGKGLTDLSCFGPPLLNQHNGSAIGLTVRKSNIVASLAHSVSRLGLPSGFDGIGHCFSTFGQVVCQLPGRTKVSVLGLHEVPKLSSCESGMLSVPVGFLTHHEASDRMDESSSPPLRTGTQGIVSTGSIALKLDSELDEYTRLGGWIEMKNSNPKNVRWAVNLSDISDDEFGWGMSLGGIIEGPKNWDHFQVESYLKFNMSKRFSLKPGLAYVVDGNSRTMALMLRSNWSL
ncbi:hypothetical protein SLE2022_267280 [Rubroshorea leprosula]